MRKPKAAGQKAIIRTVRELARVLGREHSTILRWRESTTWPVSVEPPWSTADLATIRRWSDKRFKARHGLPDERAARLRVLHERAEMVKLQRQILAGRYHLVEDCEATSLAKIYEAKGRLLNLRHSLVDGLRGKSEPEWPTIIAAAVNGCLNAFADNAPLEVQS
jgi:hypothetical protein